MQHWFLTMNVYQVITRHYPLSRLFRVLDKVWLKEAVLSDSIFLYQCASKELWNHLFIILLSFLCKALNSCINTNIVHSTSTACRTTVHIWGFTTTPCSWQTEQTLQYRSIERHTNDFHELSFFIIYFFSEGNITCRTLPGLFLCLSECYSMARVVKLASSSYSYQSLLCNYA